MKVKELADKYLEKIKVNEDYARIVCNEINKLDLLEAKHSLKELIAIAYDNNLLSAAGWFINNYAWACYDLLDINEAMKFHNQCVKVFESVGNIEGMLHGFNGLFAIYAKQQRFNDAISLGIKGMEIAEENKCYEILGIMKTNVIATYTEMGEFKKAIEVHEQIEKLEFIISKNNIITNNNNRGLCELRLGNYDDARRYLEKALKVAREEVSYLLPHVLAELANSYTAMGRFDLAEKSLREAEQYVDYEETSISVVAISISLAELEFKKKNYEEAIYKYIQVYERIKNTNFRNEIKQTCYQLSNAYKCIKKFEEAHCYLEKYINIDLEIQKSISSEKLAQWNEKIKGIEEKTYKNLYKQTESLYELGQSITSNLNKEDIFNVIAKGIGNVLIFDVFNVVLFREKEGLLEYQICVEEGKKINIPSSSISDQTFSSYCVRNKKEVIIGNVFKEAFKYKKLDDYSEMYKVKNGITTNNKRCYSALFAPIIINDKAIGVISVQNYEEKFYDLRDLSTLKIVCTFVGIALENARLYTKVQNFAIYDDLTKVLNKREVLRRGKKVYENTVRNNKNIGVIMLDIDNFKNINDTFGHQLGDRVIEAVACTIQKTIRDVDIVGRYGGEEFIIFLKGKNLLTYSSVAERIRSSIEDIEIKDENEEKVIITVSIGVSSTETKKLKLEKLIAYADNALYKAKRNGKNRVEFS